jgi:Ras-related protein Rab-1A
MSNISRDYDYLFKLVIVGDSGVGKSSVMLRFSDDKFEIEHMSTIGVDFRFRTVVIDKTTVKLQIYDTAGQERFKTITNAYYRGADGIILCYDVTDKDSFDHVDEWLAEISRNIFDEKDVCKLIIGNKADLKDDRVISEEAGQHCADKNKCLFLETSAKVATNVDTAFLTVAKELVNLRKKNKIKEESNKTVELKEPVKKVPLKCCWGVF